MILPRDQGNFTSRQQRSGRERGAFTVNLAPLIEAVGVLSSPLEWGGEGPWLAECLRRAREVRGVQAGAVSVDTETELERLLRLPGDGQGWLRAALDHSDSSQQGRALPPTADVPDALLPVVSLRCALAAGLATLTRLQACWSTLGQAFDEVDTGMAIYRSDDQREVARNARWTALLVAEPERDRLVEHVGRRVRQAATVDSGDEEVELTGGSYRLVGSRAAAGMLLQEPAVLILMVRAGPGLPTTQELRVSFGLRGREPQVALLAAEGLSNADIARRLRLSAHTVRHYLERVLNRLGLHTRKALAVHLMVGPGERPQPLERKSPLP
jgi:DNA-binding CsgD family transcriptional regulator